MTQRSAATQTQAPRVPELDGLRGVAILLVVLMHYFYNPAADLPKTISLLQKPFALGWSGVDLFFVLSGFLIGGILLDYRDSPSYFRTFYARRFFRIVPIYYAWISLFILFVFLAGPILRANMRSGLLPTIDFDIYQHYLFLQNLWEVKYVTIAYWWLSPTWSLAVEEQYYLIAPLLVRYVGKLRLPLLFGTVMVVAPLVRIWIRSIIPAGEVAWPAYRLMPCRSDSLALGMLAAYAWRLPSFRSRITKKASAFYSALIVLFAGMVLIWWRFPNPNDPFTQSVGYTIISIFYCLLLLISIGLPSGPVARFMRLSVLREVGRVSYCMYLIHLAVGYFCFGFLTHDIVHFTNWRSGLVGILSLALTYLLARLSWTYLEHPLLRIGHRFKY